MRILLLNVHHPSIGSSIADHLPPLGLLSIGGPLIDDGHEVRLIDGELGPMSEAEMADQAVACAPEVILFGHSGSTSAHAVIAALSRRLRDRLPQVTMIYGGVFPTYHWREILAEEPQIDLIVRGEGEETCRRVVACLAVGRSWDDVPGIAYRRRGQIHCASPAPLIRDLDSYRVAWELIEHRRYTYWGGKCRRGRPVLAGLSAPLHLLRATRFLDALATPRPAPLCCRTGPPATASMACASSI